MKGNPIMRFFKFKTSEIKQDIIWKFNSLRAMEPHMIFTFSDDYYETRIGLHTYINGDIIKGYYESGRINRFDSLESEKAWLSMMGMPMFCCDSPLINTLQKYFNTVKKY